MLQNTDVFVVLFITTVYLLSCNHFLVLGPLPYWVSKAVCHKDNDLFVSAFFVFFKGITHVFVSICVWLECVQAFTYIGDSNFVRRECLVKGLRVQFLKVKPFDIGVVCVLQNSLCWDVTTYIRTFCSVSFNWNKHKSPTYFTSIEDCFKGRKNKLGNLFGIKKNISEDIFVAFTPALTLKEKFMILLLKCWEFKYCDYLKAKVIAENIDKNCTPKNGERWRVTETPVFERNYVLSVRSAWEAMRNQQPHC